MRCNEIENLLPAYREDLLNPDEKISIAGHLAGCPRCSRAMADLEKAEKLLKGLTEVEPPPFFEQRIMSRVREEAVKKKGLFRRLFYPLHIKIPVQILTTLVVAVLAFSVYQQGDPEMKRMAVLPPPLTEQGKGRVETKLSRSPESPAAATPLRVAPAADRGEPRPQRFAVPPPEKRTSAEMAADPQASIREETASKPVAPPMVAKEKDATPAGGEGLRGGTQTEPRKRDSAKAMEMPPPEQKRREKAADTGPASGQSGLAMSAPSPSRMTAAAPPRSAIELTVRVRDPESALGEIESRLGRVSARIVERQRRSEGEYLKAEVSTQDVTRLLELLEAVGRVNREAHPPAASVGMVTVGITVVALP